MSLTIHITRPPLHGYLEQNFPAAEVRVIGVDYQKPDAIITIELRKQAGGDVFDVMQRKFSPATESGSADFVTQAYGYIKTLPEFAGAQDS